MTQAHEYETPIGNIMIDAQINEELANTVSYCRFLYILMVFNGLCNLQGKFAKMSLVRWSIAVLANAEVICDSCLTNL